MVAGGDVVRGAVAGAVLIGSSRQTVEVVLPTRRYCRRVAVGGRFSSIQTYSDRNSNGDCESCRVLSEHARSSTTFRVDDNGESHGDTRLGLDSVGGVFYLEKSLPIFKIGRGVFAVLRRCCQYACIITEVVSIWIFPHGTRQRTVHEVHWAIACRTSPSERCC